MYIDINNIDGAVDNDDINGDNEIIGKLEDKRKNIDNTAKP